VREFYEVSKMRTFLVVSQRVMEDSLWSLIDRGLQEYVWFIETSCSPTVVIDGPGQVYVHKTELRQFLDCFRFPLFAVTMEWSAGQFVLKPALQEIQDRCIAILNRPLTELQGITALEPLVLANWSLMYWGVRPTLSVPDISDERIEAYRARVVRALGYQFAHVEAFVKSVAHLAQHGSLDPAKYVELFYEKKPKLPAVQAEVRKFKALREEVINMLPGDAAFGVVSLAMHRARELIGSQIRTVCQLLLASVAAKARKVGQDVWSQFNEMIVKLQRRCATLEEAIAQRNFAATVPTTVKQLETRVRKFKKYIEVLEDLMFDLTPGDYELWANILSGTSRIMDAIETCQVMQHRDGKKFAEELQTEQAAMQAAVTALTGRIRQFFKHSARSVVVDVVREAQSIAAELRQATEKATKLNSHERLLGQEVRDYSVLGSLQREFDPYYTLWTVVCDWRDAYKAWYELPFGQIDAGSLEELTERT
jgi:hypothetical protein